MLTLTRGEIITEGLSQAGRPDLVSNARLWLNLFLEKIYLSQDFSWLIETDDSLSVIDGGSLPLDYRAAKSVIVYSNGQPSELRTISDPAQWDDIRRTIGQTTGVPQYMYLDLTNKTYRFAPRPQSGLTMSFSYYSLPELPVHTIAATDLETPIWGLSAQILIDAIKTKAFEYNDDQRADTSKQELMGEIAQDKLNSPDKRAGRNTIPFGKSFKRRF